MAPARRVSVVVPTYRRCASVRRALGALMQQTLPADEYEVIVAIDGSEDGTREMLEELDSPYQLRSLWQPKRGRAAACNAGIRIAAGELIVLLDDDMEPASGFLEAHLRAHQACSTIGLMGAAPIAADDAAAPVARYVADKFNQHMKRLARPDHQMVLRDFYSGNFSIHRHRLLSVGGFDEAFAIYGNEDLELSIRLQRTGVRLAYSPAAVARQHYTKTFADLARDTFAKGQTAVLLASKHPEALAQLRLGAYARAGIARRLLRRLVFGFGVMWHDGPERVIRVVEWLENQHFSGLESVYRLTLDYCYWLGVKAALRESHRVSRDLAALPRVF